jgi:hypothetical protein
LRALNPSPQPPPTPTPTPPPPPTPTPTSTPPLKRYDQEAMYFHAGVREAKRAELLEGLATALAGPFDAQTRHISDLGMVRLPPSREGWTLCLRGRRPVFRSWERLAQGPSQVWASQWWFCGSPAL